MHVNQSITQEFTKDSILYETAMPYLDTLVHNSQSVRDSRVQQ